LLLCTLCRDRWNKVKELEEFLSKDNFILPPRSLSHPLKGPGADVYHRYDSLSHLCTPPPPRVSLCARTKGLRHRSLSISIKGKEIVLCRTKCACITLRASISHLLLGALPVFLSSIFWQSSTYRKRDLVCVYFFRCCWTDVLADFFCFSHGAPILPYFLFLFFLFCTLHSSLYKIQEGRQRKWWWLLELSKTKLCHRV
jgi:hypothetical protein